MEPHKIPKSIWALGFVSMFMDVSTEMIHSLLPIYLVSILGVSAIAVGMIEGIAESTSLLIRIFSGTLSDYLGKRKLIATIGYGIAAATKPLFAIATSLNVIMAARFVDRLGKGIRGAPRDALIGDLSPLSIRGACFGLRQSLDNVGAIAGPLIAILLMWLFANNIKAVFWAATIPAFVSFFIILVVVKEPKKEHHYNQEEQKPFNIKDVAKLHSSFWWVIVIAVVISFARMSEAFLVLKAQDAGFELMYIPLVLVIMNLIYASTSYPAGKLSDKIDRMHLLSLGTLILLISDLLLAYATTHIHTMLGVALWGLHMGVTQGIFAALIVDKTPAHLYGTAFGIFNFLCGLAILFGNIIAGWIWSVHGAQLTFLFSSSLVGLMFLIILINEYRHRKNKPIA